jgi:hypothetical protein
MIRIATALGAFAVVTGCAGTPTVATVPSARDAGAAASAAQPVASPPAQVASAAAPPRFPGKYPRTLSNGQTVYCWTDTRLGTRVAKETCATAEVLERQSPAARGVFEQMRATTSGCNPSQPGGC